MNVRTNGVKKTISRLPVSLAEVETIYRHKQTGELFKERKDWETKGYKNEDMAQDVKVIMPPLDLVSKT